MKIVTFKTGAESRFHVGAITAEGRVADLTSLVKAGGLTAAEVCDCYDLDGGFIDKARRSINGLPTFGRAEITMCAPVPRPPKIICVGLNYRDHAIESKMAIPTSPITFTKFPICAIGSGESILLPSKSTQVDYEAELAVVVGRRAKHVAAADAMNYVFGYANFNDVSARDFQFADGQWSRGKSCDTFAPMGEFVATKNEIADPHDLRIRFRLNGETMQDSRTDQLIFRIPEIIEFLSASVTLEPGDVIATGTPPGVGFARKPPVFLKDGDVAEVEIEGLGVLTNAVRSEVAN